MALPRHVTKIPLGDVPAIPRGEPLNGLARRKNESKKASFPANTLNDLFWF
jgi:hypothetical protein